MIRFAKQSYIITKYLSVCVCVCTVYHMFLLTRKKQTLKKFPISKLLTIFRKSVRHIGMKTTAPFQQKTGHCQLGKSEKWQADAWVTLWWVSNHYLPCLLLCRPLALRTVRKTEKLWTPSVFIFSYHLLKGYLTCTFKSTTFTKRKTLV